VVWILVSALAAVVVAGALFWLLRRRAVAEEQTPSSPDRIAAPLVEFTIAGAEARAYFETALPAGETENVIGSALVQRALAVVRAKRPRLPMSQIGRIVAFGRRGDRWAEAGAVDLAVPGVLPGEPGGEASGPEHAFDPLEALEDYPGWPPRLDKARRKDELAPLCEELHLSAAVKGRLRAQGIDPDAAGAGALVLGVMEMTGYRSAQVDDDTFRVRRLGRTALLRVVEHRPGEHPELEEADLRRFVVDVVAAGVDVGLLVTEKYAPFEVYEREQRDRRLRFITRERLQRFIDALDID
jgi:hypothetical protein